MGTDKRTPEAKEAAGKLEAELRAEEEQRRHDRTARTLIDQAQTRPPLPGEEDTDCPPAPPPLPSITERVKGARGQYVQAVKEHDDALAEGRKLRCAWERQDRLIEQAYQRKCQRRGPLHQGVRGVYSDRRGVMRILDLFCGGGGAAHGLLPFATSLVGWDIDPRCRRTYPGLFRCGDVTSHSMFRTVRSWTWAS